MIIIYLSNNVQFPWWWISATQSGRVSSSFKPWLNQRKPSCNVIKNYHFFRCFKTVSGWTWYVPSSDFQPKPTILCWSRHTLCNSYICVKYLSTIKGSSRGRHFSSSCWSPARLIRGSGSVLGSGRVFPRHNWKQAGPPPICQYLAAALEGRRNKRTRHNQDTGERVWPCFTELEHDDHLFR